MDALQIVLVAAVVIFMIVRRFAGAPVQAKSLALPIALTAYGIYALDQDMHGRFTVAEIALLAVEAIIGVLAGLGRGATIRLYLRGGHLWQSYTMATLGVWIALIVLRIGLASGGHTIGVSLPMGGTIMATFGLSLLVESLVVQKRAAATGAAIMPQQSRRDRRMMGIR
jgi:membrane protein CcdC involved in cytochrome C biogenesis